MKRHHDHSNSYKGQHLIEAGLCSPLSSWWKTWQLPSRQSAGKGAESSTSWSTGSRRRLCATLGIAWAYAISKPLPPIVTHFLQQATPTLTRSHLLVMSLYGSSIFKLPQVWTICLGNSIHWGFYCQSKTFWELLDLTYLWTIFLIFFFSDSLISSASWLLSPLDSVNHVFIFLEVGSI